MNQNKYLLIKYNRNPIHTNNLLNKGEIWFSKISEWASDKEKGDKFETIVSYKDIEPGSVLSIFNKDKETKISITNGQMVSTNVDIGYASSFYLLNLEDYEVNRGHTLPTDMQKYGETCVMIFDSSKFINHCKEYFKSINIPLFYQKVKYDLGSNFENKDIFSKRKEFNIEKEFRFYIPVEKLDNQLFSIGSIESFGKVLPFSAAFKFGPNNLYPGIEPTMII